MKDTPITLSRPAIHKGTLLLWTPSIQQLCVTNCVLWRQQGEVKGYHCEIFNFGRPMVMQKQVRRHGIIGGSGLTGIQKDEGLSLPTWTVYRKGFIDKHALRQTESSSSQCCSEAWGLGPQPFKHTGGALSPTCSESTGMETCQKVSECSHPAVSQLTT